MDAVLLFKDYSQQYAQLLETNGLSAIFIPPLEFAYVNAEELSQKLVEGYHSGIIFTSPRAVNACISTKVNFKAWSNKPIFVVGKSTESLVRTELNLSSIGSASGNADLLSDFIIASRDSFDFKKPLLFPSGNLKRETLPAKLKQSNIPIDCVNVYTTKIRQSLTDDILQLKQNKSVPSKLVFFSPSGVDFVMPILQRINYDFESSFITAIGPSTEHQIKKWNLTPHAVAFEPTAEAVLLSLLSKLTPLICS